MGISADSVHDQIERQQGANDPSPPQGTSLRFPDKILEEIAQTAQRLTASEGAALALSDQEVISCRACSGYLTPPVGTELNTQSGLTATCIQTGEIVRCDDTRSDVRVDSSRCGSIRSTLAVPIFNGSEVAGILAVFSAKPNCFTDKHAVTLQLLARMVEAQVGYASRGNDPQMVGGNELASNGSTVVAQTPQVGCLSCGQRNPQDSQFCNRCGVVLSYSAPATYGTDLGVTGTLPPLDQEGLREIYKLIAGDSGLGTWNDIYAKLLTNLENSPLSSKARTPAETGKKTSTGNSARLGRE